MDQTTLDDLRTRLTGERKDIVTQLEEMGISPETGDPTGASFEQGFADSGAATAEKARLLSMSEGLLEILREIDASLQRMEEGKYGICVSCDKEIAPERLEIRPYSTQCMECKQRG